MTSNTHFINGAFVAEAGSASIEVVNPANGNVIGHVPDGGARIVDRAVAAARAAQPGWAALPAIERAAWLRRLSAAIREHSAEIARIVTEEQGKTLPLAEVEASFSADYIDYMAEWARRIEGEILTSDRRDETMLVLRKPLGVVGGILPWNFPFFLIARKAAPALVTGNTVVLKPSELTPLNALVFARILEEVSFPAGVINIVFGAGATTGAALSAHPGIDMISFTGSVETGRAIMRAAALNITRVNLELGGKAPVIVLDDADLDLTAKAIWASRITNTGQLCNCAERIYVQRGVADALAERLAGLMSHTRYGDPLSGAELDMGPLIDAGAVSKIDGLVSASVAQGARVLTGGAIAADRPGFHYLPTVLTDCHQDMPVMRREVFGPVIPLHTIDDLDQAIALANDSEYGLTSSIFTQNLSSAMKACHQLQFGETYVNREHFEAMQGFHAGRRHSGIGGADGRHGLYEHLATHVVYLNHGGE